MKKLVLIILCLLLVSCTPAKRDKDQGNGKGREYIALLEGYATRAKDPADPQPDDPDFDRFLDEVFKDGMAADFMTMHFSVIDYRGYGIEKPPVDLGVITYGPDEESITFFEDQLKTLQSFDFDKLSYRQKYDYEALEYSIYETLADSYYYRFNFLFSSGSNLAENIISNFTDYTFYDQESIDDYLTCLSDLGRYFDDALAFTEAQDKDGYGPVDPWIDYTIDTCEGVLNKSDDNTFITTFDDRIDKLDFIDQSTKEAYKQDNRDIFKDVVVPAYTKLAKEIEKYRGKNKLDDYALYKLDPDYVKLVYMLNGSSNKDIDTVFQDLEDNISDLEALIFSGLYQGDSLNKLIAAENGEVPELELVNEECLDYLNDNLNRYYPDLGEVEYDIQELDADTAPDNVVAYYWPSPLDNSNQNIIRTNPNNMIPGFKTYTTLAHEGMPGHLYQHVFYYRTAPHNFRSVIGFSGYTEGWAVNAQRYAVKLPDINDEYAEAGLFFDDAIYFPFLSLVDIGVNYYGWTAKDIQNHINSEFRLLSLEKEDAEYYHELMIEMPGVYTPYGVGVSSFLVLENKAKAALGEAFDPVAYHEVLLKNGPLPFNILEDAVNEYIQANS